jgi:hypothetical protein
LKPCLSCADQAKREVVKKHSLRCTFCGYGVFRSAPPEHCLMCQAKNAWIRAPRRPSTLEVGAVSGF